MSSFSCIRACASVCRFFVLPPAFAACFASCSANCIARDP